MSGRNEQQTPNNDKNENLNLHFSLSRKNYWTLINQVVTQIVLDKKGIEPDFSTKYKIPVTTLVEGFATKDRYKQIVEETKENKAKLEALAKDKDKLNLEWNENFGLCFFFKNKAFLSFLFLL